MIQTHTVWKTLQHHKNIRPYLLMASPKWLLVTQLKRLKPSFTLIRNHLETLSLPFHYSLFPITGLNNFELFITIVDGDSCNHQIIIVCLLSLRSHVFRMIRYRSPSLSCTLHRDVISDGNSKKRVYVYKEIWKL